MHIDVGVSVCGVRILEGSQEARSKRPYGRRLWRVAEYSRYENGRGEREQKDWEYRKTGAELVLG